MPEIIPLAPRSRHPTRAQSPATRNDDQDDLLSTPQFAPVPRTKQASVMVSAFLAICLTIGYNQCYGVFQEYYLSPSQTILDPAPASMPNPPTALLAFVGTLGSGLTWAGSIVANPLISRLDYAVYLSTISSSTDPSRPVARPWYASFSSRWITLAGVVMMTSGFLLASVSTKVWQLLLSQGLLYGLGSSLLYFPLLGPAPEYFTRHRATALGVIFSGAGIGGLILSPMIRALFSAVGGRWTLRVLAGLCLLVGGPIALAVPSSRFSDPASSTAQPPSRRRTHISGDLLTTPVFVLSGVAAFCQAAGAQLPLTFIPTYSVSLGMSASTAATLLAVANAVNAIARIAAGYAGDRFGRLNALVVSLAVAVLAVAILWGTSVKTSGAGGSGSAVQFWLAFIVIYSVATGGYAALFPATIADVFGIRSYAAVNGFIYFIRGCGTMVGSPVGGTLIDKGNTNGGLAYTNVVTWDGALMLGSAICILGVRWADALRRGWMWRA